MIKGSLSFLLGVLATIQLSSLPSLFEPYYFITLISLSLIGVYFRFWWLLFLVFGLVWAIFRADLLLSQQLPQEINNHIVQLQGIVHDIPQVKEHFVRFDFHPKRIFLDGHEISHNLNKVRLSWYGKHEKVQAGQSWSFSVKMKPPHGFRNPVGFDYEAYLFRQGIRATGYIIDDNNQNFILSDASFTSIASKREKFGAYIKDRFQDHAHMPLLIALTIGERNLLTDQHWKILTESGTSHLLAISGLHVGLISGFAFFFIRWIWSCTGIHFFSIPAQRVAAIGAIFFAIAYAGMAGFSIPTQRALIMVSITMLSFNLPTPIPAIKIFALTLFLMILHDPFCVLTAGFWLSFTAIALLIYGYAYRITSGSFFEKWGRGQLLLVTGMLPVLLFWFQKAPTFASLANLVCVPWVSLITLPLIFIGCLMLLFNETLANYILFMSLNSLDLMWNMLDYISKIQSTSIYTAKPGLVVLILAIIGLLVLHLPAGVPARMSGILLTLPLFFPVKIEKADTTFTMTMLEVGQGLAIVVETRNHVLVYDTGPAYSSSFDAGEDIILPFLRSNQHSKVDLLIQSHGDLDHIGGLVSLMKSIEIDSIVTSVPDEIQHSHVMYCKKGQFWKFDDITIEVLHPPNRNSFKGNNASCVVKISNGYLSVLLTGDIEKTAESSLVISQNKNLSADFLIAPHHGSKTSSTQTFIDTVGPDFVLFPVGHGNRFGFPKSDIVARYSASSVTTLASDQSGAIEIIIKDDQFEIVQHGVSNKRFWHTDI